MGFEDYWLRTEDGLRLYVRDYAHSAPRHCVLCLHGLTRNSADFAPLAERLAPSCRVLVMEQRGRGRSDRDSDPRRYQVGTYVRDALALLDALGLDEVVVIGTSMGGLMAMTMAGMQPQRFRGLVLNDIGPVVEAAGLERIRGYVGKGGPVDNWEQAVELARANNEAAFPDFSTQQWAHFARHLFVEGDDGRPVLAYDPAIAQPMNADTAAAVPADLWPLFDSLTDIPMLVIRGALSDILSGATVVQMQRRHPRLDWVEVENRGHAPMLDEPAAVRSIEAFLERL